MTWERGSYQKVWHWNGHQAQEVTAIYLGQTSTGEHAFMGEGWQGPFLLGRQVFDTEAHARWWAVGDAEAKRLLIDFRLESLGSTDDD